MSNLLVTILALALIAALATAGIYFVGPLFRAQSAKATVGSTLAAAQQMNAALALWSTEHPEGLRASPVCYTNKGLDCFIPNPSLGYVAGLPPGFVPDYLAHLPPMFMAQLKAYPTPADDCLSGRFIFDRKAFCVITRPADEQGLPAGTLALVMGHGLTRNAIKRLKNVCGALDAHLDPEHQAGLLKPGVPGCQIIAAFGVVAMTVVVGPE